LGQEGLREPDHGGTGTGVGDRGGHDGAAVTMVLPTPVPVMKRMPR
jgi:hypothetical protein